MKKIFLTNLTIATLLSFAACGGNQTTSKAVDGPTFGDIKISVDETFAPLIDSQLTVFHSSYKKAHVTSIVGSEAEVIDLLLKDSVHSAIVSRTLTEKEIAHIKAQGFSPPKALHFATDAIAVIVHPSSPDMEMTYETLQAVTQGKIRSWSGVPNSKKSGDIQIVFDNPNSSTVRFIQDSLNGGIALPPNVFATQTTKEIVEHVAKTPNAIGFIGVNWVSNPDDPKQLSFLKQVGVVALYAKKGTKGDDKASLPFQAHIALKTYPLRRNIYSICREPRNGLGTGFAAFLAEQRGQLIVQHSGILPAQMQARIVKIKK